VCFATIRRECDLVRRSNIPPTFRINRSRNKVEKKVSYNRQDRLSSKRWFYTIALNTLFIDDRFRPNMNILTCVNIVSLDI